ncbi:formimidoylglutamase [Pedobacter sp. KR3-3]|uniref:Formimidoylglutamase n=1 Tax=Pedobacter albus TaxID=3113905 RepID=A0ABU7IAH9_9SPHI|nr:formimidoylglutamase [Pedobacter sp. KR3-3]MEE1946485.1 formimidoylglutamase [Pedobacter sp. KR3-3]
MDKLRIYTQGDVLELVNTRPGETKLGEKVLVYHHEPTSEDQTTLANLKNSPAKFVLLGIPEDIGVRANYGTGGTASAWPAVLKTLLNTQSNPFLTGEEILVLGHFDIAEPLDQSITALRDKTAAIDLLVYPVIQQIVAAGKIPMVIGGGHNNAFPIIWGTSLALQEALNLVNIDAHADLRNPEEGRHSGNGFSHALAKGYLNQYRVFGLHQNYVNQALPHFIAKHTNLQACYFDDLLQQASLSQSWSSFVEDLDSPLGLEIDLDSIENVLSSASSPSGFALNDIRSILLHNRKKWSYLHICEGATKLANGREDLGTGKTIAYLVTDFVKNYLNIKV